MVLSKASGLVFRALIRLLSGARPIPQFTTRRL